MSKKETVAKVKQFAQLIKNKFPIVMVILESSYQGEEKRRDGVIEVAVVVERLDKDYIEAKSELTALANQVDPRIDVDVIQREKQDSSGFFAEIRKKGEMIYEPIGLFQK